MNDRSVDLRPFDRMLVEETRTSGGAVTARERPSSEPKTLRLSANVELGKPRVTARLTVTPADSVEIEDSPTLSSTSGSRPGTSAATSAFF